MCLKTMSVTEFWTVQMHWMNTTARIILVKSINSLSSLPSLFIQLTESGVPFYPPPHECPDSSDIIGACDVSDCSADIECEEGKMCCLNNCNQRFCTEPRPVDSPPCRAIVDRLSANISYIPQCDNDGYYQPIQCSGEGENRMCWCVNVFSGVPFSRTTSNRDSLDCHSMFVNFSHCFCFPFRLCFVRFFLFVISQSNFSLVVCLAELYSCYSLLHRV